MVDSSSHSLVLAVPDRLGLPLDRLRPWLRARLDDFDVLLSARKIDGGQSNPTWLLTGPARQWILRAKPAPTATLIPSAHAIEREFQVMSALGSSGVPVPRVQVLCEDESVIGVAFYVMDFVEGRVLRDVTLPDIPAPQRRAYFDAMNDTLVRLHKTDWRAAGLQNFGRHEGYFSRLIHRWSVQYRASIGAPTPGMEKLMAWLPDHIPAGADGPADTCISHGDFRLENLMFHPTRPDVSAVLDWELATLGHPLSDLAYNCLSWHLPAGVLRGMAGLTTEALGLPSQQQYVARYCHATGRDPAQVGAEWPFYLAFNLFRLAAILQGVAHRQARGVAASASALTVGAMASPVAERGWSIASGALPALSS